MTIDKNKILKNLLYLSGAKFIDLYVKTCNEFQYNFGEGAIVEGILGNQTLTYLPAITEAIKTALMPNANLNDIRLNESWFLDYCSWRLSTTFKNVIASKMNEYDYSSIDDLTETDLNKIFLKMFMHLEEEYGVALLRSAMALASYAPDKALFDKYEKEEWTPETIETVSNKDNFKTTSTSKFKTETSNEVYGFNSSTPVPTGGSTASGLATDNENVVSGNENDNNSEMTRSYEGSNITEKEGYSHSVQDTVIKEIELRKIEFVNLLKDAIRKTFFMI